MSKVVILILALLLSGFAQAESAALLVYKIWEQGVDPYISRILVTPNYVRLDEGDDADGDYTLFDRQQEIIYNVSREDHSILVINPEDIEIKQNATLVLGENRKTDAQAPKIAGIQPIDVELTANGELCEQVTVAPGLMETALDGLRELKQVLAHVQAATNASRPSELQTPCDLATNIHAPTRSLDFGLPIQERSEGRGQVLQDYAASHDVNANLFEMPEDYRRIVLPTDASL